MPESTTILLLIDDATIGGGQQHVLALAEKLDRARFAPVVACAPVGYLVDALRLREVAVHPLALSNRPSPRSIAACAQLIRRTRAAIVHSHGGTAGAVGRVAAALVPGTRSVHTHHGLHYLHTASGPRRLLFELVDRALLGRTDHVICVAQSDHDLGVAHRLVDPRRASVIPNGIDVDAIESAVARVKSAWASSPTAASPPTKPPLVGTVGRLHRQKGQTYLVEAATRVLRARPEARFQIVGDGELRGALEAQIRDAGLLGRVDLLGARTDVPAILAALDVFVLPSLWEGLPLALLEAMAAGVPCVATRVDGIGEVIDDRVDGLLVAPADAEQLADAIVALLDAPDLGRALAARARTKVRARFGVEEMVRRTEDVYDRVLSRAAGSGSDRARSEEVPSR